MPATPRVYSFPRGYRHLYALIATAIYCVGPLYAQTAGAPPLAPADAPSFELHSAMVVIGGITVLLTIASALVVIWDKLRPKPPLYKQFAALTHGHEDALTRKEHERIAANCAKQRMDIRAEFGGLCAKMERQIDYLRNDIATRLDNMDRHAEERASRIHNRIDPIAERVSANTHAISNHLEDHRKGGK